MSDVKKFQVLGKFTPELVPSAQVGQTIVVKAVDETGKPTEWEATDFPEGGSGGSGSPAIIDVTELPTENIREDCFYRLLTGKFISNYYGHAENWICHCVNGLPETGEPVSTDMLNITAYYNTKDSSTYGYADSNISSQAGIPVGWYPLESLAQAFNIAWGGITTDPNSVDDTAKLLLQRKFYMYDEGWRNIPLCYEMLPAFDIQWNGDMTGKFALDMSLLGYEEGLYFVKVSDYVPTIDQVVGGYSMNSENIEPTTIYEYMIDDSTYPGAFTVGGDVIIAYASDTLNAAVGLPSGTITNGVYFGCAVDAYYVSRFAGPTVIAKLDEKYLPDTIARRYDLDVYISYEYLNENYIDAVGVKSLINTAITGAIGGSY